MNSEANIASYTMLGYPDICCHTTVLDRRQHILSFYSLTDVHGWKYSVSKVSLRWNLETRLSVYINCLNPAFSTIDNSCMSHTMKLPIASTKAYHRSLSFGSGLTHFITFCSVGCDCSTSSSFSPSAFNNSAYSL